jgi:REP element-mobilizing transposase RayT
VAVRRPVQLPLPERPGRGGARKGAGRKRRSLETVGHCARPIVDGTHALHITVRVARGVWNLRSQRGFRAVRHALEQEKRRGELRIAHYTVQGNHLHLIAETSDRQTLTRRMQGFGARFARSVNAMMGRKRGRVIAERYHLHVLKTPRETRNAIRYVLLNHVKHAGQAGRPGITVDPYSSGPWFAHWPEGTPRVRWSLVNGDPPLSEPCSWLLNTGWRRGAANMFTVARSDARAPTRVRA